jgi:hypothetical protein
MSAAKDLLRRLRRAGIEAAAPGGRLFIYAPIGVLTAELKGEIGALKGELLELLLQPPCPGCGRTTDAKARCWRCHYRPCAGCGRSTGSAYIANCVACGARLPQNGSIWADE